MSEKDQLTQPVQASSTNETVAAQPVQNSPPDITTAHPPATSWPPAQQNFRRRETFPSGVNVLLIILALILIGGGLAFILYTATLQYRASLHAEATAIVRLTAQTQGTAQAHTQATANVFATANAKIYATATAQAAVTATLTSQINNATATATALNSLLARATAGTPALNDSLTSNTASSWDETNGTIDSACAFTGGDYHANEARQGYFQLCLAQAANFSNFAYQVRITIDSGRQDGIVFRVNSATESFYLFRIGADGSYALDLYQNGKLDSTLSNGYSAAITQGLKHSNKIAVIAYKSAFRLYVNQQFIASATDSSLSSGAIGIAAIDYLTPTEAEFSNAQVWNVSST